MDRATLYDYADGSKFIGKQTEEIFTEIANENLWLEAESVSGIGSAMAQTAEIRKQLPEVLAKFHIKTLFDVPCGDFNWFRDIDLGQVDYLGGDIVKSLITRNNDQFARQNIKFVHCNLITDEFTAVDLVFCRDCLVHFSFADIFRALGNIKKSQSKYLMLTTFPDQEQNQDITTGGWRPLDFTKAPFYFPKPVYLLNEKCTEQDGIFYDKSLGLWQVADLQVGAR